MRTKASRRIDRTQAAYILPVIWPETAVRVIRTRDKLPVFLLFGLMTLLPVLPLMITKLFTVGYYALTMFAVLYSMYVGEARGGMGSDTVHIKRRVVADSRGVLADGVLLAKWQDVDEAALVLGGIRLFDKSGRTIEIDGPAELGQSVLDQFGFAAAQRVTTLAVDAHVRAKVFRLLPVAPAFLAVVATLWSRGKPERFEQPLAVLLACIVVGASIYLGRKILRSPNEVVIGLDALLIRWTFGKPRSVPLSWIQSMHVTEDGLLLVLSRGDSADWSSEELIIPCPAREAETLIARIREAQSTGAAVEAPAVDVEHTLGRNGQSVHDWIASLRTLLSDKGGNYRAAMEPAVVMQLLEDPQTKPEVRVAAAIALTSRQDEPTRTRLRVAIDTAANPELQQALLAAYEGDEATCEEALRVLTLPTHHDGDE